MEPALSRDRTLVFVVETVFTLSFVLSFSQRFLVGIRVEFGSSLEKGRGRGKAGVEEKPKEKPRGFSETQLFFFYKNKHVS